MAGRPFEPATAFHPPRGRYTTVHYGLMIPNLPAPLNFLDVIAVVGQPKIALWRNDHLVETTPNDTANLLIGSGVTFPGQFSGYQVERDMVLAPDSSVVRFGDDFSLEGTYPNFTVSYRNPAFEFDLEIRATDKVAHFASIVGGLYDHWSLLCEHEGTVTYDGGTVELAGLNTLEYARGASVNLPFRFFTYHVLNIDESTQVLMTEVRGPGGLPIQQSVYVRALTDHGGVYEDGFRLDIHALEHEPRTTPNGVRMHLGTKFEWRVNDESGDELIKIIGATNDDYVYGMAGGYVGSYQYAGRFRGRPIEGIGYIEYVGTAPR
jgi:hypothetical protein